MTEGFLAKVVEHDTLGRPEDENVTAAFQLICKQLDENQDEFQFSLHSKLSTSDSHQQHLPSQNQPLSLSSNQLPLSSKAQGTDNFTANKQQRPYMGHSPIHYLPYAYQLSPNQHKPLIRQNNAMQVSPNCGNENQHEEKLHTQKMIEENEYRMEEIDLEQLEEVIGKIKTGKVNRADRIDPELMNRSRRKGIHVENI
ncbi:hypothetical protein ILUMI_09109 [Ignelater luminosus]|uniref:Uncharacterized protein n=1 Tax=Ignelater luminosus TaxID=2038154 RepID=A0A8K0D6F2_IGNLU|nr:hypothetical protein ILUMI_09109 [Ignelater luminosus]